MRKLTFLLVAAVIACFPSTSRADFTEGFDDITVLAGAGWSLQNVSSSPGTTSWFQGNSGVFPAQSGAPTSYIGANFNNVTGTNTIDNWLIAPEQTFQDGDVISFFTRTVDSVAFPDRLQVRLSTNGSSTTVGDFTTLLLDINSGLTTTGYPNAWTQFSVTLSGLGGPVNGRFAFRYFVPNGGPTGANSDYIGIDTVSYTSAIPEPSSAILLVGMGIAAVVSNRRRKV